LSFKTFAKQNPAELHEPFDQIKSTIDVEGMFLKGKLTTN